MEVGVTMELGNGRGGQLGEEDIPYIVEGQIQPLSTNSACDKQYYHKGQRYYREALRYYRWHDRG